MERSDAGGRRALDSQEFRRQRRAKGAKKEESLSVYGEKILWDRESKLDLKEVGLELESTIACRTKLFLGQGPSDISSLEASQNTQLCITNTIRWSEDL